MANPLRRAIELVLDRASVNRVRKDLSSASRDFSRAFDAGFDPNMTFEMKEGVKQVGDELEKTGKRGKKAGGLLSGVFGELRGVVGKLAALIGVTFVARKVVEYADGWKLVAGRLKLVTDSSENLRAVQGKIFDIAQRTRTAYESTAALFTRVALQANSLGRTQDEILQLTETVQKSIQLSGAGQSEATAGVIQFSQALASGVLRGDEFRSVMENLPGLAATIALGMDLQVGQLRALANEGELTAHRVTEAILRQRERVDRDFKNVPLTIGQAFQFMGNALQRFVGMRDEVTDASGGIARAIVAMANAVDPVGRKLDGFFTWFERQIENLAKLTLDEDALEALFQVERIEAIVRDMRNATSDAILAAKIRAERVGDLMLVEALNALLEELDEKARTAAANAEAAAIAAGLAAETAAKEAAKLRREEEDKRLAMVAEAHALNVETREEAMELMRIHARDTALLAQGNLTLEERLRLTQRIRIAEAAQPALAPIRERALPGLPPLTPGLPDRIKPLRDPQELAKQFRDAWLDAYADVQSAAERMGLGIAGSFQDAFSTLFDGDESARRIEDLTRRQDELTEALRDGNVGVEDRLRLHDELRRVEKALAKEADAIGQFMEALFRGTAAAALGALADLASAKVVENIARAFQVLGEGSAAVLVGNVAGPAIAAHSAGHYFAAAGMWAAIGGGAAAAQGAVGGGGRGGMSGGLSSGARDPVGRSVDRREPLGPELHIHFIGPGFNATNPTVQDVVLGAEQMARERYGNARVRVHKEGT